MKPDDVYMNPAEIVRALWRHFHIRVLKCQILPDTSAHVYCLDTVSGTLALKEYPSGTALEAIELEVNVCSFLSMRGYTVPRHLSDSSGEKIIAFQSHYFTVYPWIAGWRIPFHSGTPGQSLQCAELYGRLVHTLADFPVQLKRKAAFDRTDAAIGKSILDHEWLLSALENSSLKRRVRNKLAFLQELKAETWAGFEGITWKNSHGDYNPSQILFAGETVSGLLDFTSAKQMPVIYELFRSFLYFRRGFEDGCPDMREFAAYLHSYEKYETLSPYDIQFAVRCYYLRILKSVFGYQQYAANPENVRYLQLGEELYRQCMIIHDHEAQLTAQLCKAIYE